METFIRQSVIFLISMKYMAYTMNGGTFFEPAVKGAWMLTWEALYGALILAAFLLLLKDICSLGLWLLGTFGVKTGFSFNRFVFIVPIFIVSVAGGFWGMYEGIKVPEVKTETIVFKNLPAQWKGTTIALLSDLHVMTWNPFAPNEIDGSKMKVTKFSLKVIPCQLEGYSQKRSIQISNTKPSV